MTLRLWRFARWLLLTLVVMPTSSLAQGARHSELYFGIVEFKGPENIAPSVSTILNFHIWRTLRRYPGGDSRRGDFGIASIYEDDIDEEPLTHEGVVKFAAAQSPKRDLMLWGKVHEAEGKIIALSYLTIPPRSSDLRLRSAIWKIKVESRRKTLNFELDLPQRAYAFHSITVPSDLVGRYRRTSDIPVTRTKGGRDTIPDFGDHYRVANDGDHVRVRDERGTKLGWMYLPQISKNRIELTDFIGGLIRILRADWRGAIELLDEVIKNPRTPTGTRIDSYLLKIRARSALREIAEKEVEAALTLGPGTRRIVQYALMYHADRCFANEKVKCAEPEFGKYLTLLTQSSKLFMANEDWYDKMTQLLKCRSNASASVC